nr:hypothetical protein GCM10025730_38550 [Promicromonospora thailandica]
MTIVLRPWTGQDNVGASAVELRHGTAWMYYWLSPEARGKRYAAGALAAVSSWAFASGLYRLELGHRVNNPASCRVATRAGFQAEGIEQEKLRYGTIRYDVETKVAQTPPPSVGLSPQIDPRRRAAPLPPDAPRRRRPAT